MRRGTHTAVARDMKSAETADQAYARVKRDIDSKMKRLHRAMERYDREQAKEPRNWGYVGYYGYISEVLDDLLSSMNA